MVITDGVSQEITQLDDTILCYYPQVFSQQFGWNLITHGWDQHCPAPGSAPDAVNKPF